MLEQSCRNDQAINLVRALVDARDPRVAIRALDREFARVAVATEHLHGFVDDVGQRFAGRDFVDRAFDRE